MDLDVSRRIKNNVLLKNFSNLKVGGKARYFFEAKTVKDLISILEWWQGKNNGRRPIFILAGGTNVLFSDKTFNGLVIKVNLKRLVYLKKGIVFSEAGVLVKRLVNFCLNKKLAGLEWANGLPGTLGGAVRGNAGCFGREIKNLVLKVISLETRKGKLCLISRNNKECFFGYRSSLFKKKSKEKNISLIIGVFLKLSPVKNINSCKRKASFVLNYRKTRHPMEFPSLGSTFKNIPVSSLPSSVKNRFSDKIKNDPFPILPAAVLLDKAGMKGKAVGGARFSEKHANFIVNFRKAKAKDILKLISMAKKQVLKKFKIQLEEEIEIAP